MVLALVLIPALAGLTGAATVELHDPFINVIERLSGLHLNLWAILGLTVVKLAAFVGFMLVVGRRVIPWILHFTAHTGSRELFRLAVLAIALGVAAGAAYLFGVSLALGAFFAGMILSESELSNRAAQESLPFRDAFAVLFFVSVGMLFDPMILVERPLSVLGVLGIVIVGKTIAALAITHMFGLDRATGLTVGASLAQVGEFSFILAALGVSLGALRQETHDLILAAALLSISLNPFVFAFMDRMGGKPPNPRKEGRRQRPALDPHECRPSDQRLEQRRLRPGHEGLQTQGRNLVEQGRPPPGVQMRRGLVQQKDGRRPASGQPADLGQDQVQDQGLLLSRRPLRRRTVLLPVKGRQIRPMRSEQRPPRRPVPVPRPRHPLADPPCQRFFVFAALGQSFRLSDQGQVRLREGPFRPGVDRRLKHRQRTRPR
eukprot:gene37776-49485_t